MSSYWLQLYTGNRFFLDQESTQLSIIDVAWQLSRIPRFNGATSMFGSVSVAEHSHAVMEIIEAEGGNERDQMCGLLHDAHEMIFGDVPKPVKAFLKDIHGCDLNAIAAPYQAQIELALGVDPMPVNERALIHKADLMALAIERRQFMPSPHRWDSDALDPPKTYDSFYGCWDESEARHLFQKSFERLKATLDFEKRVAETV